MMDQIANHGNLSQKFSFPVKSFRGANMVPAGSPVSNPCYVSELNTGSSFTSLRRAKLYDIYGGAARSGFKE